MGKTPKPLRFLVHEELFMEDPDLWGKMAEQGHDILLLPTEYNDRLIIGRNCWKLFDLDGLNLAIQAERRIKFVPGEKKEKKPRKPRKKKEVEE